MEEILEKKQQELATIISQLKKWKPIENKRKDIYNEQNSTIWKSIL